MRADLHIHSNYSDGIHSPAEIFSQAAEQGIGILSITDHDTVDHLQPCREEAAKTGITFISGVEFSTSHEERDVHILGYALDDKDPVLLEYLEKVRLCRVERAYRILELLGEQGVNIPREEIDQLPARSIISRPLIARLMVKYKFVRTIDEAFVRFLRTGSKAFVPYSLDSPARMVELINRCDGISVLAHPSLEEFETLAPELCRAGLMGVEVFRPQIQESDRYEISYMAEQMGLVLTGGSDWHYNMKPRVFGDFTIDEVKIRPFLELVKQRQ
ncbi:PHP domain-containing protein [Gemmatimonadota bacterium]